MSSQIIVRLLLAALFIFAGIAHFTFLRRDFIRIVPPVIPYKDSVVLITGVMEILGGIGLIIPQLTQLAGMALILYLIGVFPANIYGARNKIPIRGFTHPSLSVRFPFQFLLIVLLWWSAVSN